MPDDTDQRGRRHRPSAAGSPWRQRPHAARPSHGHIPVPGRHPAQEALDAGRVRRLLVSDGRHDANMRQLVAQARRAGVPVETVSVEQLAAEAGGARHQGVVALADPYPTVDVDDILERAAERGEAPLLVVAAGVEDPRNLGALVRCAEAAGAHGLVMPSRRAAPLSPTAAKASAGALAHLPVAVVSNVARTLAGLKERGIWTYGADLQAHRVHWEVDWTLPSAVVIGHEGHGLARLVRDTCDEQIRIPMRGRVGSLNASAAAAVVLFEAVHQRLQAADSVDR